jgi:hypothetical protein
MESGAIMPGGISGVVSLHDVRVNAEKKSNAM